MASQEQKPHPPSSPQIAVSRGGSGGRSPAKAHVGSEALYRDLRCAVEARRTGRLDEAVERLNAVLAAIGELPPGIERDESPAVHVLASAALSHRARVLEAQGLVADAARDDDRAAAVFQRVFAASDATEAASPGDPGAGPGDTSRIEAALHALEEALPAASESAPIYRRCAEALIARHEYPAAARILRHAVSIAAEDGFLRRALAESLQHLGKPAEAAQQFIESAFLLVDAGRHADAIDCANQALALAPGDWTALTIRAEAHRRLEHFDAAVSDFDAVVERTEATTDGVPSAIYASKGAALYALGRHEEAIDALDRALALTKNDAWTLEWKGLALAALGRRDEAVAALREVIAIAPKSASAYLNLADLFRKSDRLKEAAEAAQRALTLLPPNDPGRPALLQSLAETFEQLARYDDALEALDRLLVRAPDDAKALWMKARLLRRDDQTKHDAIAILRRLAVLQPEFEPGRTDLVNALRESGHEWLGERKTDEAIAAFHEALQVAPGNPLVLGDIVLAHKGANDYPRAIESLESAMKAGSGIPWVLGIAGAVLCDIAEFAGATVVLQEATRLDEQDGWNFGALGWALEFGGTGARQFEAAREAYARATTLDSQNLWAHKGVANALYRLRRVEEATREYQAVIKKVDALAKVTGSDLATCGWCYFRSGQPNEAIRRYADALSLDPTMVESHFDIGLALLTSKRQEVGVSEYREGLTLVAGRDALQRRGFLFVARDDVRVAIAESPGLAQDGNALLVLDLLDKAIDEIDRDMADSLAKARALVPPSS